MAELKSTITVTLTKAGPLVKLRHFEHLTTVKIEKCFEAVTKEVELAGAENG